MIGQGYANAGQAQMAGGAAQAAGYLGAGQAQASNYLTQGNIFSNTLSQGLGAYSMWKQGLFDTQRTTTTPKMTYV
jgi:hypothetical protein